MKKHSISFESSLSGLDQNDWSARILEIGAALGSSRELGDDHIAVHLEAGPNLLVTFEDGLHLRREAKDAEPIGFSHTRRDGWSTLSILAKGRSAYRDQAIFDYIDELTDEGVFDSYDNVLFYGEVAGAYAACAYSVAAPGSTVLAISPFATLTPRLASFDIRSRKLRKVDFTSRYGFAPAMVEAAKDAFIVYNTSHRIEVQHAAMFIRDNVTLLPVFGNPQHIAETFEELDIHEDIIQAAMAGSLTTTVFADQYRARRENAPYLRGLVTRAIDIGHEKLALQACTAALRLVDDEELQTLHKKLTETVQPDALPTANIG